MSKKKNQKPTYRERYIGTTKPRKKFGGLYIATLFTCMMIGYVFSAAYVTGGSLLQLDQGIQHVITHLFHWYGNPYTLPVCAIAMSFGGFICLWHWSLPKKFAWGYEQGDEAWADIYKLCEKLKDENPENNRILTEHMQMSTNAAVTDLNNNVLLIGSPGSWKSLGFIIPNLLQCIASMVITDPKGELLKRIGNYLLKRGYCIQVLNLIDMSGDGYNPFVFIRTIDDIPKLITVFFENTEDPEAVKGEPFWRHAEMMLDQAIMTYLYMEEEHPSFPRVVELINMAKVVTDQRNNIIPSALDRIFDRLSVTHPARILYQKAMTGAADTIRSIVISAQARLNIFANTQLCNMMSHNQIDFQSLGLGVGKKKKKSALFMVIPDSDKTYNSIAAMCYTQLIQELYRTADAREDGKLPIPVTMWLDEFANIAMPKNFLSYLSTMRGRMISAVIVIQGIAQLKDRYKELWESVPTCCDTIVFLGGSSLETNKWISESLGKITYDKMTHGESFGLHGGSSRNYDVYGRELMTPSELRRMPRGKALVLIAGQDPVYDDKYKTLLKAEYKEAVSLGVYHHRSGKEELDNETDYSKPTSQDERMQRLMEKLKEEDQMLSQEQAKALEDYAKKQSIPLYHFHMQFETPPEGSTEAMLREYFSEYTDEQYAIIREGKYAGIPTEKLEKMLSPSYSARKIRLIVSAEMQRQQVRTNENI